MSRDKFAALLEKYQAGTCTDREKELVEYWFALTRDEAADDALDPDLTGIEERMWAGMQETTGLPDLRVSRLGPFRAIYMRWAGIAASLLLIAWFTGSKLSPSHVPVASLTWTEKRNDGTTIISVALEDGSVVDLGPRSSLHYPAHFAADQRVVLLKGNGFFQVRRDPAKPFLVHSGAVVTRVLGTSFHVRTETGSAKTNVEVVTGLVSVYNAGKKEKDTGMQIKPNHKATFDPASGTFTEGLAARPRLLDNSISFRFSNTPLSEVALHIQHAWGITVEAENPQLMNCPLTADLNGQPLFTQLDIICAALGARYQVRDATIRISGPGCKIKVRQAFQTRKPIRSYMRT